MWSYWILLHWQALSDSICITLFYLSVRSGTTDKSKTNFLQTKMFRRDGAKLSACLLALAALSVNPNRINPPSGGRTRGRDSLRADECERGLRQEKMRNNLIQLEISLDVSKVSVSG